MNKFKVNAKAMWVTALFLVSIVASLLFLHSKKNQNQVPKADILSPKYEYWTIHLNGEHTHHKCGGKFLDEYSVKILFPKSLSKIMAQNASEVPLSVVGEGIYSGTERASEAARGKSELLPALMDNVTAEVISSWHLTGKKAALDTTVKSGGTLINSGCLLAGNKIFEIRHMLKLNGTDFSNNHISGNWSAVDLPAKGSEPRGTFTMEWVSGGASGIPLPGPQNLKATADHGTVTLNWQIMPRAKKYVVYFAKGSAFSSSSSVTRAVALSNFAVIPKLNDTGPFVFMVTSLIDGEETQSSDVNVIVPGVPAEE